MGGVLHRLQRGNIRMDSNEEFVEDIYRAAKTPTAYRANYTSKTIVIVFDNALCHNQTEKRSAKHRDLVLLCLAPYSPMYNHIEGCFSVLKSHIKDVLALVRDALNRSPIGNDENGNRITISGHPMEILENATGPCMRFITPQLVVSMGLHCRDAVKAARNGDDVQFGTLRLSLWSGFYRFG
ncbi:hypothetical protein PI125_g7602 [Phytophthora idaei]|nr:hypothetical protein PI125_g7602 [Phytophthora idaei]KAG3158306.1 hypothetical protein PI126_g7919 [Phytophthora idaei]